MSLLETYTNFDKFQNTTEEERNKLKLSDIIKKDVKYTTVVTELIKFVLINFVKEPVITQKDLEDPDNLLVDIYQLLGAKLIELTMIAIAKSQNTKKTPKL